MNLNVTTNVKNRINRINDYKPADTARNAASATKDKAVELATGLPKRALEIFQQAFKEALAAMAEYGAITAHAYKSGWGHLESAYRNYVSALRADSLEAAYEAAIAARPHLFHATTDLLIADGLSVPLTSAWVAGAKIITGSLTLTALADLAIPVMFTIAVGYAALKIRDMSRERLHEMVEDAFDSVRDLKPDDLSNLDGDAKIITAEHEDDIDDDDDPDNIVTVTEEDLDQGQEYDCPHCDETHGAPLILAEHIAVEHRDDIIDDDPLVTDGGDDDADDAHICEDCGAFYDNALEYTHHVTVEHDNTETSA